MSDSEKQTTATPQFSNKTYDRLKYVALVLLPAIASLYFGLDQIWGLPKAIEIVGTITVVDTFLGMLLRTSNQRYKNSDARFDGHIDVVEDEGTTAVSVAIDGDPEEILQEADELTLKVHSDATPIEVEEVVEAPKPRKRAPRKKA